MEDIVRITTDQFGKQNGVRVTRAEGLQEIKWSQTYNIEYFDKKEITLADGDYPISMFDQVIPAANFVAPGEPTPISTYYGYQLKKEFKKFK